MINIRKGIAILLSAAVISLIPINPANAETTKIYETRNTQRITSGATLENITRLTSDGWLNINVLRINLSDPYLKIDTMTNSQSLGKLTSALSMAKDSGAIAAINASFFTPLGGGTANPSGPVIKSGEAVTAASDYNKYSDSMGSFSIDALNNTYFNYWKTDITLVSPNGTSLPVAYYNKVPGSFKGLTILDRKWSSMTPGSSDKNPNLTEMIVAGGVVSEIRQGLPSAQIPENGYVVITTGDNAAALSGNFKAADTVTMNITTNPDWKNITASVSGGSILVKEGKVPSPFSFDPADISKRNPRTVIANTKDGKTLMFVTVDGRQNSSIGMTQAETAQFMLELGAYNALNLDGGGSTTMVARKPGTTTPAVINSPSDGIARGVSTGLGLFSLAPKGPLASIIIEAEDTNVFVNTSKSLAVKGFDKFFNPVEVKPEQIKWTVSGIKGTFKDSLFRPSTIGEGTITAAVGKIKTTLQVSSLSSPVKLILNSSLVKLPVNHTKTFTITGYNKNGYTSKINPADVKWTVSGKAAACETGVLKSISRGTGYLDASVGNVHAYCPFSITSDVTTTRNTFEALNAEFQSYPDTVTGSFEISTEQFHTGKASGKLTYDFSDIEGSRAAYIAFADKGIPLEADSSEISVWVYNDHENSNWVRAEVLDSAGKRHYVEFVQGMDWTGWKQLEASLDDISSPAWLTRLYVVQTHPVADSGNIYFDDLATTVSGYPAIDTAKIPKNTVPADDANKAVSFVKGANNFRFGVFGSSNEPRNPLEKLLLGKLRDKINKYLDFAVYAGENSVNASKGVKKPIVTAYSGYKSIDYKNSRFIKLDMNKGGLRTTDAAQWSWLFQQLDSAKGSNVFIALESNPWDFTDSLEAKLFKDTLAGFKKKTKKNIWVFYKGSSNTSDLDRGVRYISCAGLDVEGLTPKNTAPAKYIMVIVKGSQVTFEYKPLV